MDDLKLETRLELEMVRRAIVEVSRLPGEESLQTQEFLYQKFHLLVLHCTHGTTAYTSLK